MLKNSFLILTAFSIMLLTGCEEKRGIMEQPEVFSIQPVSVPQKISVSRIKTYSVAFKVTHPEGVNAVDSVLVTFFGGDQATPLLTIGLYDDGGVNHPGDGDVIAGDGIYANTFESDSLIFPLGPVFVRATAIDQNEREIRTDLIKSLSLLNAPPVLVSASVPDTLPSGSPTVLFAVTVQDSNDVDDLDEVILSLKQQGLTIFSIELDLVSSSAVDTALYGAFFDSSFAAERIGDYELAFQAVDLSDDSSNILSQTIFLENTPPVLFDPELPDTLSRQTGNLLVQISTRDPQGMTDVDSVYFQSRKPDSTLAAGGFRFILFDDGNNGDPVAGDGQFSWNVTIPSDADLGTYTYMFRARDKVGNLSDSLHKSFVLVP